LRSEARAGQDGPMEGAFVLAFVLCVVMPIAVILSGGIASAILGTLLYKDNEKGHEGSELLETNI
jgi:hypothetical protein